MREKKRDIEQSEWRETVVREYCRRDWGYGGNIEVWERYKGVGDVGSGSGGGWWRDLLHS